MRKKRVSHLQNGESSIVLVTDQSEVLIHPIDRGVGYVDPVQESKDEQQAKGGNDLEINFLDQGRLVDARDDFSIVSDMNDLLVGRGSRGTQSWHGVKVSHRL